MKRMHFARTFLFAVLALFAHSGCGSMTGEGKVSEHWLSRVGQEVELRGMAWDVPGGAVVSTPDGPIYVEGMEHWPRAVNCKSVKVTGILRSRDAGASGTRLAVENAKWESL